MGGAWGQELGVALEEVKAFTVEIGSKNVKHRKERERSLGKGEFRAHWGQRGEAGFAAQRGWGHDGGQ